MHFSICLATGFEGVMYPIPFCDPRDFAKQAQLCERLGYHSVWGNDHITTQRYVREKFPGQTPNFYEPLITLSMCAQATEHIKLGTALLVMPMREPVYLAKQIATLDQLSGGRFILGVGSSHRVQVVPEHGLEYAKPITRLRESVTIIRQLLATGATQFDGETVKIENFDLWFQPRRTALPIYVAAVRPKMMAVCGISKFQC